MKTINILLVEDNELNQFVLSSLLKKNGMQVSIARDGEEAINMVRDKKFHLVLMDLRMPVMDGYESTNKIRAFKDPYFKNIPIIALTSSMLINSKEKAEEYGLTDVINKPFQYNELQNKITTYVYENRNQ